MSWGISSIGFSMIVYITLEPKTLKIGELPKITISLEKSAIYKYKIFKIAKIIKYFLIFYSLCTCLFYIPCWISGFPLLFWYTWHHAEFVRGK